MLSPDTRLLSFDLWCTLIRSHPGFKARRNERMRTLLCSMLSPEAFDRLARMQDQQADRIAEARGRDVLFAERVTMVAQAAGCPSPDSETLERLYAEQAALLEIFPPCLIDPDTPQHFAALKERGYAIGLISNTGCLHGDLMRRALAHLGIDVFFEYMVFSNEVGFAKPHPCIFQRMAELSRTAPAHITHIGDNLQADVLGAQKNGMRALHMQGEVTLRTIVLRGQGPSNGTASL
ncbi:MAG: HAD family hydrolase [Zoogloeaceae bacterium]|nr:HAD family hydrolase [Zoogloeaceae bacterium]